MSRVLIYVITLDSMFPNSFSLSCGSALTPVPTSLPSRKKKYLAYLSVRKLSGR